MLFFDVSVVSLILLKTESLMFSEVVVFDDSCSEFTDSEVLMVVVFDSGRYGDHSGHPP